MTWNWIYAWKNWVYGFVPLVVAVAVVIGSIRVAVRCRRVVVMVLSVIIVLTAGLSAVVLWQILFYSAWPSFIPHILLGADLVLLWLETYLSRRALRGGGSC